MRVEKMGTGIIQRDGVEYELTTAFSIDIKHNATTSKDRTKMFMDQPSFSITVDTGKKFVERAQKGIVVDPLKKQKDAIMDQLLGGADPAPIKQKIELSDRLSQSDKKELLAYGASL